MYVHARRPKIGLKLSVETLESRRLLSGFQTVEQSHCSDSRPAIVSSPSSSSHSSETHLTASLSDPSGGSKITGFAKLETEIKQGTVVNEFKVQIVGATAGEVVNIAVTNSAGQSTPVGTIIIGALGVGKLEVKQGLPTMVAGDVVSLSQTDAAGVVTQLATGTLAAPTNTPPIHQETKLRATLVDTASRLTGKAEYESETEHGLVFSKLEVEVKNGTPGAKIDVSITVDATSSSVSVGTILVGSKGKGKLTLRSKVPAITTASVITLSSITTASDGTVTLTPITSSAFATPPVKIKK
jgi:hypothetical protein